MKQNDANAAEGKKNKPAAGSNTANAQDDGEPQPLDKTEGRMNNGETGGAGQNEDRAAMDEKAR